MEQHFRIAGTGLCLPKRPLTAEDVDRRSGMPLGWTAAHVGVRVRYECAPPETLASMGQEALGHAMRQAGVGWGDIDLLIDGSACRHQPVPCNAAYLLHCIGEAAEGVPGMDVQGTCLGFLLALHVANGLFASGPYRHIAVVCAEAALKGVNWDEPESACLMGDGAAAAILRRAEPSPDYGFAHETFAQHLDACQMRGGGFNLPPNAFTAANEAEFRFHMDGPRLVQVACKHLPGLTQRLIEHAGVPREELHVIPHQAAPRALALVRRLLRFRAERFHQRVTEMGNLIAASIPAVLHECLVEGVVTAGDRVLLLGTSAGYAQAGLIFRV